MRTLLAATAAAALLVLGHAAAPASATTLPVPDLPGPEPVTTPVAVPVPAPVQLPAPAVLPGRGGSRLTLSIEDHDGLREIALVCPAADGSAHPHAEAACEELAAADGDPGRMATREVLCTMMHRPVTARAEGSWLGRPVSWRHGYTNACAMHAATGTVFDF
ncbi:SSI family serine proteinase inhibitor [Kitasatospora camelliae]|uniref:SSI family serine proteinase inhibitor n=1 Tax=Kitasatospora camelliae TaxID=3156397 RepID=A0AAU8JSI9_9ACTN